ncbi:hypothetical protein WJX84_003467 [Apatococcus fuscideae]|uniref:Ion transport domain-containing protein n=1 Tax=Apatococcus fuscideae TaxID=2026836 RepID=A0AAW1SMA1_9CHLO
MSAVPSGLPQSIVNPLFEAPASMSVSTQQMAWHARQGFERLDSGVSVLSLEQEPNANASGVPGVAGRKKSSFLGRILSTKGSMTYGPDYRSHRSMFIFSPNNALRRLCIAIMTSFWFEMLILLMIAASAVFLAMNGPTEPNGSTFDQAANYADIVFASAFAFEMVIKMIAMGLIVHPGAYFRVPWNLLDFVIVVTSLASLAADVNNCGPALIATVACPPALAAHLLLQGHAARCDGACY